MTNPRKVKGKWQPLRRRFLGTSAAMAILLVLGVGTSAGAAQPAESPSAETSADVARILDHLFVYHGPINVGIVRDGEKALLIDCGAGSVAEAFAELGISKVEQIVFTHHHRDQACGAYDFASDGAKIGVPAAEHEYFADPKAYWAEEKYLWRVYRDFRLQRLMLIDPLRVDDVLAEGDQLTFGPAKIRVLDTPGHTEGSVSYLIEVDGKRVVFCGDAIYDKRQIWDLYSLQKGFSKGGRSIGGYHGFMGDQWRLVESLGRIKELEPNSIVPSHGKLMGNPADAIDSSVKRLERCYEKYVAISALRHYFPELFTDFAGRPGQMPIRPGIKPPDCLRHFGTTWMVVSETGSAFVMDVGSTGIVSRIKKMLDDGEIKSVDGLWVTHYHYDHTNGIPKFQEEFDCFCRTDRRLAEVLTNPMAWRLPCLAPEPIRVHRVMEHGESWRWREFKMTAYSYPGQTLYHDALLVEVDDLRMLFVGDSHTMAGIDDYCAFNRNWLGRDVGFQYCISLIERLKPTHIFNCHVNDAFTFTPEEIQFMRKNLDEREKLFGELVPWDHANYGMDASWVRCHPYTQKAKPGDPVRLEVVITNHSTTPNTATCRAVLPKSLGEMPPKWVEAEVPPKAEKGLPIVVGIPSGAESGRYVIPINVQYGSWHLPQFAETIIDVVSSDTEG